MTEEEQKDLDILQQEILAVKTHTFSLLRSLDRATDRELVISGYRGLTNAEAMRKAFQDSLKKLERLNAAYLRKYPDEV